MAGNELDAYAQSRQRANDLAPIEEVAGPQVANEIGDLQQKQFEVKQAQGQGDQTPSAWDYALAPIKSALGAMHDFSTHFRGMLVKKKWTPATGEDVTGLPDEVITPEMQKEILSGSWYHQAFPMLLMPKRVVNLLAETATDPFMLIGGTGVAAKGLKGKPAPKEGPASSGSPASPPQTGVPGKETGVQASPSSVPASNPASSTKSSPEPKAAGESAQTSLFSEKLQASQLEEADKLGLPVRLTDSPKLEPGTENAQTFLDGFGRHLFEKQIESTVSGKQLQLKHAPEAKNPGTQLSLSPHAAREPIGTEKISTKTEPVKAGDVSGKQLTFDLAGEAQKPGQMSLPGVGKAQVQNEIFKGLKTGPEGGQLINPVKGYGFRKDKDGIWQLVARGDTRFQDTSGDQLRLALKETVNLDDKLARMRSEVDAATLNDPQRRAVAQHLLDSHVVNAWTIKGKKFEDYPPEAYVVAENAVNRSVVEDVSKALENWKKDPTNDALKEKAIAELGFAMDVNKSMLAEKASRGAALRAEKTSQDPAVTSFQEFFSNMAEGTSLERATYALEQIKGTKEKADFIKNVTGVGPVKGTILQHMMNGLISSTGTPIWNFAAGQSLFAAKVFERWRMEGFKDAGIAKGGAGVMAWAFTKSYIDLIVAGSKLGKNLTPEQAATVGRFQDAMKGAKEVFTDTTGAETGKINARRAISAKNYGMEDSWFSPAIDYYGHFVNIPSYMVGASDAFLKFAVRQAAMEARAFDEAAAEVSAQLKMGKQINKADAGKLVAERRQQLMQRPQDTMLPHPETGEMVSLSETGDDMANLVSMMSQLKSGTLGKAIDAGTHNSVLFRSVMPFFRVQYLSGKEALIRTPVLGRLAPSVRADLEAGGYRAAKAHAQLSTGFALATVAASMTALGALEGDGPTDPEAAAQWRLSHTPGTIGIPGVKEGRIPYTRLGPVGQVLRFFANASDLISRAPDSAESGELVTGMATTFASLLADPQFNRDMNDLFAALATRDQTGLSRWVENKASMPVPYSALLRQVNRQIQGETQVSDGILNKAMSVIPGYNGITYYNELGRKDVVPNDTPWDGLLNNTGFSNKTNLDAKTQKVLDTLDGDRVTFSGPARTHGGVKMTMQEFMDLRKTFGEVTGPKGTLVDALDHLVNSEMYKRGIPGPGKSRQTMVSSVVNAYHQAAFAKFLNEKKDGTYVHEDFRKQYQQTQADKYILNTPGIE